MNGQAPGSTYYSSINLYGIFFFAADILEMVDYAASKNVKLCAYVYPALHFMQMKE